MDYGMTWIEPEHSKGAVRRAGEALAEGIETDEVLTIANNWRAAHARSLNPVQGRLRYQAEKISPQRYTVTQRLKRMASIKRKLARFPTMKLDRMQDLGGCRAVLPSIRQVYELRGRLTNSEKVFEKKDYIKHPQPRTGYRGIHLLSKRKEEDEWYGLCTEIQLRTELQHAWATAVEIVGTFLRESLKSGEGSPARIEYFRKVSLLFSKLEEGSETTPDLDASQWRGIREDVASTTHELEIGKSLSAFAVIAESLPENIKDGYLVLRLDLNSNRISGFRYSQRMLAEAMQTYEAYEREGEQTDTVLVSGQSIRELKQGYPNYFADSQLFQEALKRVIS